MFWHLEANQAVMIRSETGSHASRLYTAALDKIRPTPFTRGSSSLGFPEYKMVSPVAVHKEPKVFHLISLTPRILKLYLFISFTISAHLPCSYIVRTCHVPNLKRDFGESNFICARVYFMPCLAPRSSGVTGLISSPSAPEGASSEFAKASVSVTI